MDWQHTQQMQQTIYVATLSAAGNSIDNTYGSPASRSARVASSTGIVGLSDGTQKVYTTVILTAAEIALTSRVWLPGENSANMNESHAVISSEPAISETGTTDYWVTRL